MTEPHEVHPDMWCKTDTRVQKVWDSFALDQTICWRKYYYKLRKGYRSSGNATSWGIYWGQAVQTYMEHKPKGRDVAVRAAIRSILKETWIDNSPWITDEKARSRWTLVRSIVWYDEEFGHEDVELLDIGPKPATEVSFRIALAGTKSPDGDPYILAGYFDQVVKRDGNIWIQDDKSTAMSLSDFYWLQYNPNVQISTYAAARRVVLPGAVSSIMISVVQIGVNFSRFARRAIPRTRGQSEAHLVNVAQIIEDARWHAERDYWPMSEGACGLYGGCEFRKAGICTADPAVRESKLKAKFKVEHWSPLLER